MTDMQRRHFQLIADTIRTLPTQAGLTPEQRDLVAEEFCRAVRDTNANFQPSKFLRACEHTDYADPLPKRTRRGPTEGEVLAHRV